ncbi:LysR family transcriptional regulator [Devosia sp. FKR38]|uniref:LysR family transcriptional regulator n=1 Tax=Devosia sp. FKR38 TaxID=2562312 RepID=UPI0010C06D03|nr:LysR family transcriptional regulator [Devosia sp. FKR38]
MLDLNDLYLFHTVALHKGFSAAERASGIPKATLSKRVIQLEDQLGVRLLERTTRSLRLTQVGSDVYEQVEAMLVSAEAAADAAAQAQAEPNGVVRVACPQGLIQDLLIDLLPVFLNRYPKVRVQMKVINRRADLVEDGVDVALRARARLDSDPNLIMRRFGETRSFLVASPNLLTQLPAPPTIDTLAGLPTLTQHEERGEVIWQLVGPDAEERSITHRPRLMCTSFDVLRASAIAGAGITMLPDFVVASALESGALVHVLPAWQSQPSTLHAIFSSRRGLVPAVRVWLDFLAAEIPRKIPVAPDRS